MNELQKFITERCHAVPGARVKFVTFRGAFLASLLPRQQREWSRSKLKAEIERQFPIGRDAAGVTWIGNLSMVPPAAYALEGGRLVLTA